MRTLLILRGAHGSGKSYWVQRHQLSPYTLDIDALRALYGAPIYSENGFTPNKKNEKVIRQLLLDSLAYRMKEGDLTVIDGTHARAKDFKAYKELATKNRYQVYCVDFSEVPLKELLRNNCQQSDWKRLPEKAIEESAERIQLGHPPEWVRSVTPEEAEKLLTEAPTDFSQYRRIHHIGDIHGCFEPLQHLFREGVHQDDLYLFLGDYIDRGPQNAEVLTFLFDLMQRPNVLFLEGNHEAHLRNWAANHPANSKEFEQRTKRELEGKSISRKQTKRFCQQLLDCVLYTFEGKTVLATHGGLTHIPERLPLLSSQQLIRGIGEYTTDIDAVFDQNSKFDHYQVHGHRNLYRLPPQASERSFNLEGQVEEGGALRIVTLSKKGFSTKEIKK